MSQRDAWNIFFFGGGGQVNFRGKFAETAGQQYIRKVLPAPASNFVCCSFYLLPPQAILQCSLENGH